MARRENPEINAGSMADIAFLLLIFFLVTTTMNVDSGVSKKLSEKPPEDYVPPIIKEKNIYEVNINRDNDLLVEGERMDIKDLREAAISFGASKWYLMSKVDLPLAAPSIRAGINQTIMLSLAMVVVASLIGAKGLGEDVLEALQYANVGQGILAGFAILFCALILDRIVQGERK